MKSCNACGDGPLYTPSPRQCNDPPIKNDNNQKTCAKKFKGYIGVGSDVTGEGSCQGCKVDGMSDCQWKCVDHGWCAGWTYKKSTRDCYLKTWGYTVGSTSNEDWVFGMCPEVWEAPAPTTTTEPPTTTADPCKNKFKERCEKYGTKYCKQAHWKEYMDENCPENCGTCGGGGWTTEAPVCGDKDDRCEGWGADGSCGIDSWKDYLKEYCAKSCGYCGDGGGACFDKWQCEGYDTKKCTEWPDWTKEYCPKMCGHCGGGGGVPPCKDSDKYDANLCKDEKQKGSCEKDREWMEKNCKKTCGFCGGGGGGTTEAPVCVDKDQRCDGYKKDGHCEDHWKDWMEKYCKKTCGKC